MTIFNKISLLVILLMGMMLWAQSGTSVGLTSATTGSACALVNATGTLCEAGDGLWYAAGTGAFQKVYLGNPPTAPTGVTSFNGLHGDIASGTAGIAYSDLQGTPIQKPSIACSTSSVGNSGLTASGCN